MDNIKSEFVFVKPVRAAKLLDMSKSKIYEMIQRKELPAVRLGGCLTRGGGGGGGGGRASGGVREEEEDGRRRERGWREEERERE